MNPTPRNIKKTSTKSIDLMQNTSTLFNNPPPHPTTKLPIIQIFKTGFKKLSVIGIHVILRD